MSRKRKGNSLWVANEVELKVWVNPALNTQLKVWVNPALREACLLTNSANIKYDRI